MIRQTLLAKRKHRIYTVISVGKCHKGHRLRFKITHAGARTRHDIVDILYANYSCVHRTESSTAGEPMTCNSREAREVQYQSRVALSVFTTLTISHVA